MLRCLNDGAAMTTAIPEPLKAEHYKLHECLGSATAAGGGTAARAEALSKLLYSHLIKEEEYAFPILGALAPAARNEPIDDAGRLLEMSRKLAQNLPEMLEEHQQILAAARDLEETARSEGHADVARFAKELALHAATEEQILYPAAIVVGRYLEALAQLRDQLHVRAARSPVDTRRASR
jgi:iron-sulfur cluster repair protein YtfE (RIC family)